MLSDTEVTPADVGSPASDAVDGERSGVFSLDFTGLNLIDRVGLLILGLIPVALLPGFFFPTHLRQVLVIAAMPLGVWLLGRMAVRHRSPPALAAVGFLGIAFVSAILSEYRAVALVGTTSTELSLIMLCAAFGFWSIGRGLSTAAVGALPTILTGGVALNVALGVYQLLVNPEAGLYSSFDGRMSGLMSNPVYFASTAVGVWAYWLSKSARSGAWAHVGLTFVFATSVALSGSRGASAVGLVLAVVALLRYRNRRGLFSAAASFGGVVAGLFTLALFLPAQAERISGASSATGLGLRVEVWKAAARVWIERPLLGQGPNPYLHQMNLAIAESVQRDHPRLTWLDPHNVLVLILVATGILGLVALTVFVALALRGHVELPLLAAAVAIVLSWMLQPVIVTSWPIAFALFGAAVRPRAAKDHEPDAAVSTLESARSSRLPMALMLVGAGLGAVYATWSLQFAWVIDSGDADRIEASASWMIYDPQVAAVVGEFHLVEDASGAERDRHLARAEQLAQRAVDLTGRTNQWRSLTEVQLRQGDLSRAQATALEWSREWRTDPLAHHYVASISSLIEDEKAEKAALDRVCEITGVCGEGPGDG